MPRSVTITTRVLVACASLVACAHAPPPRTTSSADLRAEIDLHTCARWDPESRVHALLLLDERCPAATTTPLARAVAAAVAEARGVRYLASIETFYYDTLAATPSPTQASADALARTSFWRDPALTRATLDRAHAQLQAHQIRCDDCEPPPAPAPRTVSWATYVPYLAAFVWPTRPEADGPVEVYVCSAINGAADLPPDEPLSHAARLAAFDLALDETTAVQVRQLARSDTSRTVADVRQHIAIFLNSPPIRDHVCASLAARRWFTGITVTECPSADVFSDMSTKPAP